MIWLVLLLAAPARGWCNCAGSSTGNFGAVLAMPSTANVTVLLGETVSDSRPTVFSSGSSPQALVMYLASTFAGGQAVAAAQMQTRCTRYSRGGFQLIATTSIVLAARNRSTLTWLHVELDLFAACASARDTNIFRVARSGIRVLPVDLMELETKSDPLGPLVDASETVCRPRASPWFGLPMEPEYINSAQTLWRSNRVFAFMARCAQICGPAANDTVDGHYFARHPARKYVQVCAYDDAVFCAADAMMLSTVVESDTQLRQLVQVPTLGYTRINHWTYLFMDGNRSSISRCVIDVSINRHNRQMSSVLVFTPNPYYYDSLLNDGVLIPSDAVNWTAPRLLHYINYTNNAIAGEVVSGVGDVDPLSTDCLLNTTLHTHHCDPLVQNDRYVHFGDQLTDTLFAVGTAVPCAPAVTAACPAIRLPAPVFSGATTLGILHGSVAGALIVLMIAAAIAEHRPRKTQDPPAKPVNPRPVVVVTAPASTSTKKPVRSEPQLMVQSSLKLFWDRAGVKIHKRGKKKSM